ncbi:serine protease (plasmid) [Ralstonia solanacearum]|uniref:S1 family peptidase n=1 Tax=Ralstonia solanacearum species complex TaxID=3116862 RepID=UPI000382E38C|nr:serine protease [Ralstonia pseudosolanacearum]AXV74736.1 serine protease [Ralstonia solanacearum]AXW16542.1 serine protease [Ralstonia solanacearum]AXW40188.1 serine protease [Ralstonia solanacearum]AXW72978.1 serine protease [Ralstonia solanacearum]MCK4123517.1 trypsin-like peptidase domain-containing protein [Ralstonia pseudosolanacearum]
MHSKLYPQIEKACCLITVFIEDEKVSEGTGFAYTQQGHVLTAAHVVTGRWPIRHDDYRDPAQKIYCKFPGLPVLAYSVAFCSIEIEVPIFTGRVQIDLAGLVPMKQEVAPQSYPFISATTEPPRLGEQVFMAGYSEEVELPFQVDTLLRRETQGVQAFHEAMSTGYMADMMGPLFKRGVVGNIRRIVADGTNSGDRVDCDVLYVDNAMHPGASGGPLFNANGEAVGVVSQRAVTSVDSGKQEMLPIPSGCTVAVSLAPLEYLSRRLSAAA